MCVEGSDRDRISWLLLAETCIVSEGLESSDGSIRERRGSGRDGMGRRRDMGMSGHLLELYLMIVIYKVYSRPMWLMK